MNKDKKTREKQKQSVSNSVLSKNDLVDKLSEAITEKNKLKAILQSIDNGVYAVDWDGNLILFNHAAEKITGLKSEEVIGKYCNEIMNIIDEEGNSICGSCPLARSFSTGKKVEISRCFLKPKRKKLAVSAVYSPIRGFKNDLVLGIGVFKDLRKEEELKQMKADFVAMAAHELRTPLTSIKGHLSILDEELENIDDEYKEFISRSLESSIRLDTLVSNILSVSKIERGKIPVSFSKFSLKQIIELVVADLSEKIKKKEIKIKINLDSGVDLIMADKEKIQEVIINFINNAIAYTPKNGRITVITKKNNDMVDFRVTDNGLGIPKEFQKKLFKKFSRIRPETMSQVKGTGLGLYISKMIIQMHKGTIGAESKGAGKGSSFYFSIPIQSIKNRTGKY